MLSARTACQMIYILSGVMFPDLTSEAGGLLDIGSLGLQPEQVSVRAKSNATLDGSLNEGDMSIYMKTAATNITDLNSARIVIVTFPGSRCCRGYLVICRVTNVRDLPSQSQKTCFPIISAAISLASPLDFPSTALAYVVKAPFLSLISDAWISASTAEYLSAFG